MIVCVSIALPVSTGQVSGDLMYGREGLVYVFKQHGSGRCVGMAGVNRERRLDSHVSPVQVLHGDGTGLQPTSRLGLQSSQDKILASSQDGQI